MLLSELIKELTVIQNNEGDMDVTAFHDGDTGYFDFEVRFVLEKNGPCVVLT